MPKKIPTLRRLLPWTFALIFVIFAPILVFYTAGYRWNPKKGVVERNGTVIVDTKPTGADIYLNRQKSQAKTPATLQNTAPGTYLIQLEKAGYHSWTKTLTVLPEMVAFANKVLLWPITDPELIIDAQISKIFSSPSNDLLVGVTELSNEKQELFVYRKNQFTERLEIDNRITPKSSTWNSAGNGAILMGFVSNTRMTWLLSLAPLQIIPLPDGSYHFEKTQLIGMDLDYKITLAKNGSLAKQKSLPYTVDEYEDFAIKNMPYQENLILVSAKNAEEGLILPRGEWRFYALDKNEILLRSGDDWLRLAINAYPFTSTQAKADCIYPMIIGKQTIYLLKRNNELYLWAPMEEPELLYRQSETIISAGWHPQGFDIFYATQTEVRMLNLDNRDGRLQTTVAWFDEIQDVALAENIIYIAGKKNGRTGLWKYPLIKTNSLTPLGSR